MRPKTNRLLMLLIGAMLAGCASQTERSSSGGGADRIETPAPEPAPAPAPAPAYEPERENVQYIDRPLEETPPPQPAPVAAAPEQPLPDFPITRYEIPPEQEVEDLGTQPDESGTMSYPEEQTQTESVVSEPTEFADESQEEEVGDLGTQPDESGSVSYPEEQTQTESVVSEPTEFADESEPAAEEPHEVADLGGQPDESGTMSYPEDQHPKAEGLVSQPQMYAEASEPAPRDDRPTVSEPTAYPDEPAIVFVNFEAEPLFNFDKSYIRADQRRILDELVASLKGVAFDLIAATGHADRIGSDAYNQKLSERRANAVKAYLIRQGVPADKIQVQGRGESEPVTGGSCEGNKKTKALIDCLQPDRRVEVSVAATKKSN